MKKALQAGWFVPGAIGATLKNVIETADLPDLAQGQPEEFGRLFMQEIHLLGRYSPQEEAEVERFIQQHLFDLYFLTRTRAYLTPRPVGFSPARRPNSSHGG